MLSNTSARNVITGTQSMEWEGMTIAKKNSRNVLTAPVPREKLTVSSLRNEERQKCEIWSRPMGYFRPISHYNIGKKQEFADRLNFKEPKGD